MGITVPRDLSIVAWDDSPLCQLIRPPLTALTRDVAAFGARAVRTLAEVLAGANPPSTETEPPTLVVRGSTAAAAR
jgi:DNA-binding LacI/PurR family transcriptional regulator